MRKVFKRLNASHYLHTPLFPSLVNVYFARLMPAPPPPLPAQSTSSPLQTKMESGGVMHLLQKNWNHIQMRYGKKEGWDKRERLCKVSFFCVYNRAKSWTDRFEAFSSLPPYAL